MGKYQIILLTSFEGFSVRSWSISTCRSEVIIMASSLVFDAMEERDWNLVKELIATTSWTPQDLEEKHGGVCMYRASSYCGK